MPKKKGSNRNFKLGMYSSVLVVVVIAFVVLLNLFVGQLKINVDLTPEKVYTLTDDTIKLADSLTDEITIYYLAKEDDEYEVLKNVVAEYDKLSHVTVVNKDPQLYPQFAKEYTDEELAGNDVIVVDESKGTSRFVPFGDMYIEDYSVNYSTYQQEYKYSLDAEGQITSAIQFVTATEHTKLYTVSAHGETELAAEVQELIDKANVETAAFDVMTEKTIPEDCDVLFINGPTTDISEEELTMYKNYLDNGGKAILTTAFGNSELTNYNSLLEYYGIKNTESVVVEKEGNYLQNYPTYLIDYFSVVGEDMATKFTADDFVIMPIAPGLQVQDTSALRSTLTTKAVISTTEDSYGKVNKNSESVDKEDGDIDGPFDIVIQATDTYKDKTSKVAVFASPYIFAKDWIDYYGCANIDLLINTIDWMSDGTTESIAIPQRSLDQVLLEVPQKDATVWAVVTVLIIPLIILAAGCVVWFKRRKH